MVPDKPQKVENFHFTWCGYIGIRTRYYVKSNQEFDTTLKLNNSEWGIRDLRDLEAEASRSEITLEQVIDLPANDKLVIWRKEL